MKPEDFLKHTEQMVANMDDLKKHAAFVGLPKEKVGGKIYGDGMTILQIGATHEFGATINHPGGTPYIIGKDGKAKFVKKGTAGATGVTKPHKITIPRRSFLRTPFAIKRKELNKGIAKQFELVSNGLDPITGLGRIGALATNVSKGAFTSQGYGEWKPDSAATKREKGSSQTLIDTGILRGSISSVVR